MNTRPKSPNQRKSEKPRDQDHNQHDNKPRDDRQPKRTVVAEATGTPRHEEVAAATPVPAAARAGAALAREPALLSKPLPHALESVVASFERSFKAAGQGAAAVNCKLIDIAQENLNSSFELVRDLAGARNPMEMMRLQMSYWHETLDAFATQAQELRALSAELVTKTNEPIREHVKRSLTAKAA